MDMQYVEVASSTNNLVTDAVRNCHQNSGTYTTRQFIETVNDIDYQLVSFDYDNCKHPNGRVFVSGHYEIGTDLSSDTPTEHYAAFNNVRILAYAVGTVYVTGATRHPHTVDCGISNSNTSYLNICNEMGEQLLLENFKSTNIGLTSWLCDRRFDFRNWLTGKAYLSELGAVSVDTPTHLSNISSGKSAFSRILQPAIDASSGEAIDGLMTLTGAHGTYAEYTYKSISMRPLDGLYYESFSPPTVSITVDDGTGTRTEIVYDATAFGQARCWTLMTLMVTVCAMDGNYCIGLTPMMRVMPRKITIRTVFPILKNSAILATRSLCGHVVGMLIKLLD